MKILILLLIITASLSASDTIHFVTPQFKPFSYQEGDVIKGVGVERITKIFKELNIPITISMAPNYGRAIEELRQTKYDGVFLATQNSERDSIAHFSQPVTINRWCWFTLSDASLSPEDPLFKATAQIATPMNTNTHKWLKTNGYNVTFPISDISTILKLLLEKKVDAVFIAEEVFLQQVRSDSVALSTVKTYTQSQRPFGIYLSNTRIATSPDLMNRMNNVINDLYGDENTK